MEIKKKPYKGTINPYSVNIQQGPDVRHKGDRVEFHLFTDEHTVNDILRFAMSEYGATKEELITLVQTMEVDDGS